MTARTTTVTILFTDLVGSTELLQPVWAEEVLVGTGSGDLPHALFPEPVRGVSHGRGQEIEGLLEVPTEAFHPD